MKVFISWSGNKSKRVATALAEWIPTVLQCVEPFLSNNDIDGGERWGLKIASELEKSNYGIICLTSDNLNSPWILFEAGCLAKSLTNSFACPYLLPPLNPSDIKQPLGQFQAVRANKEETKKLIFGINKQCDTLAVSDKNLEKVFERSWSDLEVQLSAISREETQPVTIRDTADMLTEILETVRGLARSTAQIEAARIFGDDVGLVHSPAGWPSSLLNAPTQIVTGIGEPVILAAAAPASGKPQEKANGPGGVLPPKAIPDDGGSTDQPMMGQVPDPN